MRDVADVREYTDAETITTNQRMLDFVDLGEARPRLEWGWHGLVSAEPHHTDVKVSELEKALGAKYEECSASSGKRTARVPRAQARAFAAWALDRASAKIGEMEAKLQKRSEQRCINRFAASMGTGALAECERVCERVCGEAPCAKSSMQIADRMQHVDILPVQKRPLLAHHSDTGKVFISALLKHNGKYFKDWRKRQDAEDYIQVVAQHLGVAADSLVETGPNPFAAGSGYWVDENLVIPIAGWISVEFRLACDLTIKRYLSGRRTTEESLAAARALGMPATRSSETLLTTAAAQVGALKRYACELHDAAATAERRAWDMEDRMEFLLVVADDVEAQCKAAKAKSRKDVGGRYNSWLYYPVPVPWRTVWTLADTVSAVSSLKQLRELRVMNVHVVAQNFVSNQAQIVQALKARLRLLEIGMCAADLDVSDLALTRTQIADAVCQDGSPFTESGVIVVAETTSACDIVKVTAMSA